MKVNNAFIKIFKVVSNKYHKICETKYLESMKKSLK
jgi:hypothetical protein